MKQFISIVSLATLMSTAALATTATANLTPSANVSATCVVTGNPVAFGTYNPFTGAAVLQQTTISVTCTNGMTAPPITMGQGLHQAAGSTGAVPLRQMSNGAAGLLTYNLYSDAGATVAWENVTGVTSPTPTGSAQNMNVYGKIDAGQTTALAGTYADTVIVTATF